MARPPVDLAVAAGTRVTLHFTLRLANGDVVDSTEGRQPATFEPGDGKLLPGFESKLMGLRAGDSATFTVWPEEAFGQPNPANVQRFRRSDFAPEMALTEGLVVSFADAAGGELPGVIAAVDGDQVMVDFNHPLAGRPIQFSVQILSVEPASAPAAV
ncbi:MAG: FKBP-type peptidyl-prolyl cis-trans isomerase [Spongiibacteraceae bacterium]|nr:FKBP-type peptidyl-prolyl cis-trans isomerase [Spongiibacteraceae bacterium]